MSYKIIGAADSLKSVADAVRGIDVANWSFAAFVNIFGESGLQPNIMLHRPDFVSTFTLGIVVDSPAVSGWRLLVMQNFSGSTAQWRSTADIALNKWVHIGIDYDSNTANDPLMYVNGNSVGVTETVAPSGTRNTGADTLMLGNDNSASDPLNGKLGEAAFWNRRLTADEWKIVAQYGPIHVPSGLVYYIPLRVNATEMMGSTGTLTITGATLDTVDQPLNAQGAGDLGRYSYPF